MGALRGAALAFMRRFLLEALLKSWAALQIGGHMVIHLTDVYTNQVCEKMCLMLKVGVVQFGFGCLGARPDGAVAGRGAQYRLGDCQYKGVLCSFGAVGRPRPMWVFEKLAEPPPTAAEEGQDALAELRVHYPNTYAELMGVPCEAASARR